jgi:hypothetical protein
MPVAAILDTALFYIFYEIQDGDLLLRNISFLAS